MSSTHRDRGRAERDSDRIDALAGDLWNQLPDPSGHPQSCGAGSLVSRPTYTTASGTFILDSRV